MNETKVIYQQVHVKEPRLSHIVIGPSRAMANFALLIAFGLVGGGAGVVVSPMYYPLAILFLLPGILGAVTYIQQLNVYNQALLQSGNTTVKEIIPVNRVAPATASGAIPFWPKFMTNSKQVALSEYVRRDGRVISGRKMATAKVFNDKSDKNLSSLQGWLIGRGLAERTGRDVVLTDEGIKICQGASDGING